VRLRGEVLANEDQGGPRLVVNVEPLDSSGDLMAFNGTLSLMMLALDGDDEPQSLARWDFTAKEVREAVENAIAPAMRFYLELPAQAKLTPPTELWVRLVPQDGDKLLTHAEVRLTQAGRFASTDREPASSNGKEAIQLASFTEQIAAVAPRPAVDLADGWTIARPDDGVAVGTDTGPASEWRSSSETISVMPQAAYVTGQAADSRPEVRVAASAGAESRRPYKRPTWTADRPITMGAAKANTKPQRLSPPQRPSWSATR
jgi:hypothetical protein